MKVTTCILALVASASAFAPQANNGPRTTALEATSRREAMAAAASAAAVFAPIAANAAVGESPRFSVFGLIGDGSSYSEGAAYGSDQSTKVYSPYSVYGDDKAAALYKADNAAFKERKMEILVETENRLKKLPSYIERKEWFNVKDELTRYMYETRGAVRGLATTPTQKEKADAFFQAMEATTLNATLKKQAACGKAAADTLTTLEAFVKSL